MVYKLRRLKSEVPKSGNYTKILPAIIKQWLVIGTNFLVFGTLGMACIFTLLSCLVSMS